MDRNSSFSSRTDAAQPGAPTRVVHVNFCDFCHHVWKAPAAAKKCVNCTNPGGAYSLVSYLSDVPIT